MCSCIFVWFSVNINLNKLFILLAGIMAQAGASDILTKLRLEKAQRAREAAKGASSSAGKVSASIQQVPPVDLVPPPVEKKQRKRKSKSKEKHQDAPERTPKRAKTLGGGAGNSGGHALVSHDLEFHKGVNVALTHTEKDVLLSCFKGGNFMTDLLELQARVMAAVRLLAHERSQGSAKELEDLKSKLAESRGSLKKVLEAKFALQDQVTKLTSELSASKSDISKLETRCGELERKKEELTAKLSRQHEELHGVIQDRDDTLLMKDEHIARLEQEVVALKDCVLNVAEEGFNQAVRQAVLLYGVPADSNKFDVGKEVYEGQLIPIEDMPDKGVDGVGEEGEIGESEEDAPGNEGEGEEGTSEAGMEEVEDAEGRISEAEEAE